MRKFVWSIAFSLLAGLWSSSASAVNITGSMTFGSVLNPAVNLGTATIVDFQPQTVFITSADDDLASTNTPGDLATFQDFSIVPFVPNDPLWTAGGFSFSLGSLAINTQNAVSLVLLGSGTLSGNGFDPTSYDWSLSADRTQNVIAFSATNAASAVPEPGSLLLLGTGVILIGRRRKRS